MGEQKKKAAALPGYRCNEPWRESSGRVQHCGKYKGHFGDHLATWRNPHSTATRRWRGKQDPPDADGRGDAAEREGKG